MKHFLCFAIALTAPVFAGVRIQTESTDLASGEVTKREILVDSDRLRINEIGKNTSILFLTDGGRNRLVILDKAKNEYREIDQQMMTQMSGMMSGQAASAMAQAQAQMQAQMQAQAKTMTPDQQAAMAAAMKGRGMPAAAAPVTTVFTAQGSGSANGFSCTKYEGNRAAEKVSEVCAANASDLKFTASDIQVYEKLKEFSAGMQNINTPFATSTAGVSALAETGLSGFPIQRTAFANGKATQRMDVKTIDPASLSNADFSLGDAKKIDLMGPGQGRGAR